MYVCAPVTPAIPATALPNLFTKSLLNPFMVIFGLSTLVLIPPIFNSHVAACAGLLITCENGKILVQDIENKSHLSWPLL